VGAAADAGSVGGTTSAGDATGSTDGGAASGEAPEPDPTAQPVLLLEAGGLGVVLDETRIEHLPFGTAAATVRSAVARLVGPLTTKRRTDCEQGPRTSSTGGGLELLFAAPASSGGPTWAGRAGGSPRATDRRRRHRRGARGQRHRRDPRPAPRRRRRVDVGARRPLRPDHSVAATGRVTLVSSGENCLPD
jgi:hypothetical protein